MLTALLSFVFADREGDSDYNFLVVSVSGVVSLITTLAIIYYIDDNVYPFLPSKTEIVQNKLRDSNLTLDDVKVIEKVKIFKLNNMYYIKTNNNKIIEVDAEDAYEVYEK